MLTRAVGSKGGTGTILANPFHLFTNAERMRHGVKWLFRVIAAITAAGEEELKEQPVLRGGGSKELLQILSAVGLGDLPIGLRSPSSTSAGTCTRFGYTCSVGTPSSCAAAPIPLHPSATQTHTTALRITGPAANPKRSVNAISALPQSTATTVHASGHTDAMSGPFPLPRKDTPARSRTAPPAPAPAPARNTPTPADTSSP